jgi:hypothetical protein
MKFPFLFSAALCFYASSSYAQNTTPATSQNKLKVTLAKDSMSVIYNSQQIPVSSIQSLDSLMKKIPDPSHLNVEFFSETADREKSRSISRVLGQCHCPTVSKSFMIND